MFITEREIQTQTGMVVSRQSVNLAQMMIESFTGKVEEDVNQASDKSLMAQAVMFQAVYLEERPLDVMQQAAVATVSKGDNLTAFSKDSFSPFLSPWAEKACKRLSWNKSRSIKTGRVIQHTPYSWNYAWTHDTEVI